MAISREMILEKIRRKRVGTSQVPWVATSISGVQPISLYATLHIYFLAVYKIFSHNISLYATLRIHFLAVYKIFSQNISLHATLYIYFLAVYKIFSHNTSLYAALHTLNTHAAYKYSRTFALRESTWVLLFFMLAL